MCVTLLSSMVLWKRRMFVGRGSTAKTCRFRLAAARVYSPRPVNGLKGNRGEGSWWWWWWWWLGHGGSGVMGGGGGGRGV